MYTCTGNNLSVHKSRPKGVATLKVFSLDSCTKKCCYGSSYNTPCVVCDRKINVHRLVCRLLLTFSHIPYVQEHKQGFIQDFELGGGGKTMVAG